MVWGREYGEQNHFHECGHSVAVSRLHIQLVHLNVSGSDHIGDRDGERESEVTHFFISRPKDIFVDIFLSSLQAEEGKI